MTTTPQPYQILDRPIYHLCVEKEWQAAVDAKPNSIAYFPPTFEQDGRKTHAAMGTEGLVGLANLFYTSSPDKWICLELDPRKMLQELGVVTMVEAPMPVGDQAAVAPEDTASATMIQYPHIYGGIATNHNVVTRTFPMTRAPDGTFLAIPGLVEAEEAK
jgi:uncharacterized protein (DUF952 family)